MCIPCRTTLVAAAGLSLRDGILLLSVVILPFFPFVAGLRPGHEGTFIEGRTILSQGLESLLFPGSPRER